ncbi:hypothetical protein ACFQMM_12060 [Saliphagus sp. GCM10025308]|uniref:EMC6-like membrane protein n=1 Tax=Natronosalvus caseinilyticus TaxID=2953747 RepID=UPI0028A75AA1|nr:hypothetical protein [Natronosalvus caseinilyticus]
MSTATMSDRREHIRSIGVTAFACLAGVGAAIGSSILTAGEAVDAAATEPLTYLLVFGLIALQVIALPATGLYDSEEFGPKHVLFIGLMTFSFWFITWGIMLSTGASF